MACIRASLLEREGTWDPQFFCGPIAPLLDEATTQALHRTKAQIIEGWRGTATSQTQQRGGVAPQPIYRMSNVGELELRLGPEHCVPPAGSDLRCVRPGDILVTKGVPIRAAIASSQVFRHRADANCYVIRGLNQTDGFWVALCLNQPAYAEYLTRKSGAARVPRMRMAVLREAPFPAQPVGVEALSQRVLDCLDRRIESMAELYRFAVSVHDYIAMLLPELDDNPAEFHRNGSAWHRFFPPSDIDDSLVPAHVAVNGYQRALSTEAGWIPLPHLISQRREPAERLAAVSGPIRTLQLSDINDSFTLPTGAARNMATSHRRVFAQPLSENDVLLSTLVTSPCVTFAGTHPATAVYPTDHWYRLRFRETPGAWALVLDAPPMHAQLKRLAIGTVQQFAQPSTVRRLVLPNIRLETRVKWDSFLRRWQQRRRELDDEWLGLWRQCYRLLQETHKMYGAWTQPPAALRDVEDDT
jgi:hypothetical protein